MCAKALLNHFGYLQGANVLAILLKNRSVQVTYCLVRAKDDLDAAKRVQRSLLEKGLTGSNDPRVVYLASELSEKNLGLSPSHYEEIAKNATCILHVRLTFLTS